MRNNIQQYADALYLQGLQKSSKQVREERVHAASEIAARSGSTSLPWGGSEIRTFLRIFRNHIERCIEERFRSFQQAYKQANVTPSAEELDSLWSEVKEVQNQQASHSGSFTTVSEGSGGGLSNHNGGNAQWYR